MNPLNSGILISTLWNYKEQHGSDITTDTLLQKSLDNDESHHVEDPGEGDGDGPDSPDLESERDQEVVEPPDTTEDSTTTTGVVDEDLKPDLGLLVVGGTDDEGQPLRHVDLITESGVCRSHSLPALPEGRHGGVAGLLEGGRTVMVCGGFDEEAEVTGQCWELSWNNSDWRPSPPLIHPTAWAAQVNFVTSDNNSFMMVSLGFNQGNILRHWRPRDQPRTTELSASF